MSLIPLPPYTPPIAIPFVQTWQLQIWRKLIGCDLNYICNPHNDWLNKHKPFSNRPYSSYSHPNYHKHLSNSSKLKCIFDSFNLVNVWRTLYPSACQYIYFSLTHNVYTHIDFIFASNPLLNSIISADIGIPQLSDYSVSVFCKKKKKQQKTLRW